MHDLYLGYLCTLVELEVDVVLGALLAFLLSLLERTEINPKNTKEYFTQILKNDY